VSQLDRHLTTEELSALLDDQLADKQTDDVQSEHVTTCQQCQRELAELRQMVNLLHALPQPALPRSFVLSAGILQATATDTSSTPQNTHTTHAQNVPNIQVLRSANGVQRATRASRGYRVFNLVGSLVAVVGVLFVLSGFIPSLPNVAEGSSTASTASSVSAPMARQEDTAAKNPKAPDSTPTVQQGAQAVQGPNNNTGQHDSTPDTTLNGKATQTPVDAQGVQPEMNTAQSANLPPPFLDFGATGVRIGLGILLFIAGMMSRAVGRERRKERIR